MGEKIRVEMGDWLFNAGLVGLYNILKHSGDKIEEGEQYIEFDSNLLENFEEKYFKYFIDTYEETMIFSRIKNTTQYMLKFYNQMDCVDDYERNIKFLNSKLDNSAYKKLRKKITKKRIKKLEMSDLDEILKFLDENREEILRIECTGYYDQKAKKSKSPNAILDKYINTNMLDINSVCIENTEYVQKQNSKSNIQCFTCERPIKAIGRGLSFLTNIYFDTARKTSHIWNFTSDIEICPICKLVYYCIPAGFNTIFGKGIFVNANSNINSIINMNIKLRMEILKEYDVDTSMTYRALVNSIQEQFNDNIKYELADIQVIRYENERYIFNILSKQMLDIISKAKEDLNNIMKSGFLEINTYFNIYELVIDRILNNQNLFTLIHKLLVYKLTNPKNCRFSISQVKRILSINLRIMEGIGYMGNTDNDIIKNANISGYYLREKYKGKGAKDKLNGISYRLLNALKTNNKDMFMDTLLNCYLYAQKTVPAIFLEGLKNDESFKTIGYAFVSGLIEGKENSNKNGGE